MKRRTRAWEGWIIASLVTALAAACGDGNGNGSSSTNTPTRTAAPTNTQQLATATATPTETRQPTAAPTQSLANVDGLVVVHRNVSVRGSGQLGTPPEEWSSAADSGSFNQSLSYADWSIRSAGNQRGVTGPDGRFVISGLGAGSYTLDVMKTLDGNLLTTPGQTALAIPFSVGDRGGSLVAEVSWGLLKSTSTYAGNGVQVQDVHGPYGTRLVTRDGRISELSDPSRTLIDADGDGGFDAPPCVDQVWECDTDSMCGAGRVCSCTSSCPSCDDCGPGVCVVPRNASPYRCSSDGTCTQPGDRCVCVASCPDCADCGRTVCVAGCDPVAIMSITIVNAPAQLVLGRQAFAYAFAHFSDGTTMDVTYLAEWRSSDEAVATVDSWGTVSASGLGTTDLTASLGSVQSAPWRLQVVERPTLERISLSNPFCYCGPTLLGGPDVADFVRPCIVDAPARSDILPIPGCSQVVQIGRTVQFSAIGEFGDGSYEDLTKEVEWQAAPANVADLVDGLFTGREAGTAQVTASLGAVVSNAVGVRVVEQPTVIALSIYAENSAIAFVDDGPVPGGVAVPCPLAGPDASLCCCNVPLPADAGFACGCGYTISVLRGDELKFHATAQYDTGDWRDVTDQVTWRTSNAAAAAIDAAGVMTAVEAGDTTIDAALETVTSNPVGVHVVNEATLQSLSISQEQFDGVLAKGDQRYFRATGYYDVGFARDVTDEATWHSTDEQVGGFDAAGVFTARAAGMVELYAELAGQQSNHVSLEVYETSELDYCEPDRINRGVWSDAYNRVTLESDCAAYDEPGVVTLRYTVTETQPHGGIFDPCLDLYVYQGNTLVRTIREERCGDPFLNAAAPGRDEAVLKYQLRAFWDLKSDSGEPVPPGSYTIYGRFYLYYDPVVSIDVRVRAPGEATPTPVVYCTPPLCAGGEVFYCPRVCPGGCGTICVTPGPSRPATPTRTPTPPPAPAAVVAVGSAAGFPGDQVTIAVSLHAAGQQVAGVQNDLLFDPRVSIAAKANGRPDCTVDPAINKNATTFAFLGMPCTSGIDCRAVRAVVFDLASVDPIPDGAQLYTCKVNIAANVAAGTYRLALSNAIASSPLGAQLPATGTDGEIIVVAPGGDIPTPTPTPAVEGLCYRGTSICTGSDFSSTAQRTCCDLLRLSESPLAVSWCSADKVDASTRECRACSNPCDGLPPDS